MINIEIGQEVEVSVTEEDIRYGYAQNCELCPISLAVRRVMHVDSSFPIYAYWGMLVIHALDLSYTLPSECRMFMNKFDHDKSVEPFSFKMTRIS